MKQYIAEYFFKTELILNKQKPQNVVTMQFFQRKNNVVLCGINEVIRLLEQETDTSQYIIKYLKDGSIINDKEVVLELEGHYQDFGKYEGIIDGILSRGSSIATNARQVVNVSNGKQIVYMGDRADHYLTQKHDGYAVNIGGISTQVTKAQIVSHNGIATGTIPHILIQEFEGDIIAALKAYKKIIGKPLTALVDYNNDVIGDSIKALNYFKKDLSAVRVDTSPNMKDLMFLENEHEYGVNPKQIKRLRLALDQNNGHHVRIIVSSGFNAKKIAEFEKANTPVDIYGVGASLLKIDINFSADAVKLNGKYIAKAGRKYNNNPKLIKYKKSV